MNLTEIASQQDYYPFGMPMPGRSLSLSNYRFGFNGKENDNELKGSGNQIDFGARAYDPRLGKWMSIDKLTSKYPDQSPYGFVMNSPIRAKDPDGYVVIFVNGQGTIGSIGKSSYWGGYDQKVMDKMGDHSARYVDGSLGGWDNTKLAAKIGFSIGGVGLAAFSVLNASNVNSQVRKAAGETQGYNDAESILAHLSEGEKVNIVSHSMGTAFSRGYVEGLAKYANEHDCVNKLKKNYELDIDPFQSSKLPAKPGITTDYKIGGSQSVPTVGGISGGNNISTYSDVQADHGVTDKSVEGIPSVNPGTESKKPIEQSENNKDAPK